MFVNTIAKQKFYYYVSLFQIRIMQWFHQDHCVWKWQPTQFVHFFATDTTMYSFSVRLHEDTELSDAPCVYEWVDLNIGDGYDEFSGNICQAIQLK